MNLLSLLKCNILETTTNEYKIRSWLQDDTPFEMMVPHHHVRKIVNTSNGWLSVEYHGEQESNFASITLPVPHLNYGSRITVNTKHIMLERFQY